MLEENLLDWSEKKRREGRKEGRTEGKRDLLLRLLEGRFGPVPEDIRLRIEEIQSTRRLNQLAVKVLTAVSLREMGL